MLLENECIKTMPTKKKHLTDTEFCDVVVMAVFCRFDKSKTWHMYRIADDDDGLDF